MMPRTTLAPGVAWPHSVKTILAPRLLKEPARRQPRFSPAQADEIRWLCKDGMTHKAAAIMYGVHVGTIDCVIARKDAYRAKGVSL